MKNKKKSNSNKIIAKSKPVIPDIKTLAVQKGSDIKLKKYNVSQTAKQTRHGIRVTETYYLQTQRNVKGHDDLDIRVRRKND